MPASTGSKVANGSVTARWSKRVAQPSLPSLIHATTMVHNGSIAHSVGAFDAVSICPRQQIHRPVKELSYELASHVSAYLDHQRCMLPLSRPLIVLTNLSS